jgi:hypothetical protein
MAPTGNAIELGMRQTTNEAGWIAAQSVVHDAGGMAQ